MEYNPIHLDIMWLLAFHVFLTIKRYWAIG